VGRGTGRAWDGARRSSQNIDDRALFPKFTAILTTLADISSPTTCASPLYAHPDPLQICILTRLNLLQ
jgi:hypothetical protein